MIMVTAKTAKLCEKIVSNTKKNLIRSTHLEPDCINYNLYDRTEDNNTLLMLEKWKTPDMLNLNMQTGPLNHLIQLSKIFYQKKWILPFIPLMN